MSVPVTHTAHRVYLETNPRIGGASAKKSRFFRQHPRHSSRLRHLHAWYIGKKSTIRQRFSKKTSLFTLMTVLRLIRHTGYIWEQKRNPAEILRKNLHFFVASAVRDRFRTFGISAKKLKSDRDFRKKSRFFLRAIRKGSQLPICTHGISGSEFENGNAFSRNYRLFSCFPAPDGDS